MHWNNSQFQLRYFLIGACHTADEGYRLARELEEDRQRALDNCRVQLTKRQAVLQCAKILSVVPLVRHWARAVLLQEQLERKRLQALINAAEWELCTIRRCIEELQPLRRYAHIPDHEAHQACQREEWRLRLMTRCENMLAAGGIAWDHIATMRQHPDWEEHILPHLLEVQQKLKRMEAREVLTHQPLLTEARRANP